MHKEMNVIGTMQLLAACQKTPSLRKLVIKSTAAVYGSGPKEPGVLTEDMASKEMPLSGYARDNAEVESYVRGFGRRREDVDITTLRFTNIIGPRVDTVLTRYFALPVIPTVLGYDARLQFLHESDLLAVLHHATFGGVHGTFNVAGDGVLMLSQAVRRLGRPTVAVPGFAMQAADTLSRQARLSQLGRVDGELTGLLRFGRGLDTTRMREVLRFAPRYTTASAFADFASSVPAGPLRSPSSAMAGATTPVPVGTTGRRHG
jgi:UDP-glucose 4-epimerase